MKQHGSNVCLSFSLCFVCVCDNNNIIWCDEENRKICLCRYIVKSDYFILFFIHWFLFYLSWLLLRQHLYTNLLLYICHLSTNRSIMGCDCAGANSAHKGPVYYACLLAYVDAPLFGAISKKYGNIYVCTTKKFCWIYIATTIDKNVQKSFAPDVVLLSSSFSFI